MGAAGHGRQPCTAQGWWEPVLQEGCCSAPRFVLNRALSITHSCNNAQLHEQRGQITKGKRSTQKNQSSPIESNFQRAPRPHTAELLLPSPPNNPSTHPQLPFGGWVGSLPRGWRAGWEGCSVGSFPHSARCPGAELRLPTLKQETKKPSSRIGLLVKKRTANTLKKTQNQTKPKPATVANKVFAGSTHPECTDSPLLQHAALVAG